MIINVTDGENGGSAVPSEREHLQKNQHRVTAVAPWLREHEACSIPGGRLSNCSNAIVPEAIDGVSPDAPAWAAEAARSATMQALDERLDAGSRPTAVDAVRHVVEVYALAILRGRYREVPPKPIELPTETLHSIRYAVHQNIPLYIFLRAVWIAHSCTIERLLDGAETEGANRRMTPRSRQSTERIAVYTDRFSTRITQVYVASEEERKTGGLAASRARMVKDVLVGHPVDRADAEWILGLDLADHHLSAVLWASPDSGVSTDRLDRFAAELACALGARRSLIMSAGPLKSWMWISWPRPPEAGLAMRARAALSPPVGVRASIGPVASGIAGLRRSHLSAQAAERLAGDLATSWLCEYADVAVVSLVTHDAQQAQWFVEETLGDLGQPGCRFAELRETLRVYLSFERSRVRAAESLHVARNTVAYRVEKAMKLLGRPITGDPLKIRLALEVARILPPAP